jgi:hypothetical protein
VSTRRKSSLSKVGLHHGWVAQLAEQRTENPRVGGSIPPPAIFRDQRAEVRGQNKLLFCPQRGDRVHARGAPRGEETGEEGGGREHDT